MAVEVNSIRIGGKSMPTGKVMEAEKVVLEIDLG
jgi:hypothetical protein